MTDSPKENASGQAGVGVVGGQAETTKQKKAINCGLDDINKVVDDIQLSGHQLQNASGETQAATLPKVLLHRGSKGLNTYEGVAAGYMRLAARVGELKETWAIHTLREDVIGPDGLLHKRIARYVIGKRKAAQPTQPDLGQEGQQ